MDRLLFYHGLENGVKRNRRNIPKESFGKRSTFTLPNM